MSGPPPPPPQAQAPPPPPPQAQAPPPLPPPQAQAPPPQAQAQPPAPLGRPARITIRPMRRIRSHRIHRSTRRSTSIPVTFDERNVHVNHNHRYNNAARLYNRRLEAFLRANRNARKSSYLRLVDPVTGTLPPYSLRNIPASEQQIRRVRTNVVNAALVWDLLNRFYHLGFIPGMTIREMEDSWRVFMGLRT